MDDEAKKLNRELETFSLNKRDQEPEVTKNLYKSVENMRASVVYRTSQNTTKLQGMRKTAFSSNEALFNHFKMEPLEANGNKLELRTSD